MERASAQLVIHLGGDDRVVDLREGHTDVGRAADSGIRLTLPQVSTHHAELHWDGTQLRMRDLASTNGTAVNGRPVSGWSALHDGDRVNWGPVEADVILAVAEQPAGSGAFRDSDASFVRSPRTARVRPSAKRIFVSHASEDKRLARSVAAILRQEGWDAWLDESSIIGGASWAASIQQALRSSSVVVLLVTADSVSKEWVLDEIAAARNLRVPIVPAVVEHVRLPDELQFMLQRTQFVDVSGLASFASDDQLDRNAAASRLDSAILDVLERQGRLNPDRARMRFGRVLQVIGIVLVVIGFASFVFTGFQTTQAAFDESAFSGFPGAVIVSFVIFICGGLLGATGSALVRAGRAKGL